MPSLGFLRARDKYSHIHKYQVCVRLLYKQVVCECNLLVQHLDSLKLHKKRGLEIAAQNEKRSDGGSMPTADLSNSRLLI